LQNLFEKIGANQPLENFVLINWAGRSFEPLSDPVPSLRLRQMHEIGADRAAVDAARFLSSLSGQGIQVGVLQRLKQAEGIEGCLQVAPAAESIENPLPVFVAGWLRGLLAAVFLAAFGVLARRSSSRVVRCDINLLFEPLFCHRRQRAAQ